MNGCWVKAAPTALAMAASVFGSPGASVWMLMLFTWPPAWFHAEEPPVPLPRSAGPSAALMNASADSANATSACWVMSSDVDALEPEPSARARLDAGTLGVAVGAAPGAGDGTHRRWRQWSAPAFEVQSSAPVPAGVDGEALVLDPPLRFAVHAGALRVRIAPQHPGASPSAGLPDGLRDGVRRLALIAVGRS
jgi:hypothetical protein